MRLFIGKRNGFYGSIYELGKYKSKWNKKLGFPTGSILNSFCVEEFEKITGIKLNPGEIVEIELSIKVKNEIK